ncbi:MAG: prepilin-type N-terminal cleavage/methylation domain-containing protein [Legionellaceae bacterium]
MMRRYSGFTFPEVLVSLLLVTMMSYTLLKQLWHVSQRVNSIHDQYEAMLAADNAYELSFCS